MQKKFSTDKNDLRPFFVGLFEGGASVHSRDIGSRRQPYFLLKLSLCEENRVMLENLNTQLGLAANIYESKPGKRNFPKIIMGGSSKHTFVVLNALFKSVPLLTSKKILQFQMLQEAPFVSAEKAARPARGDTVGPCHLNNVPVHAHTGHTSLANLKDSPDFAPWLSGFLEYKASFGRYANNDFRLSLTLKNDAALGHVISDHFKSHHKVIAQTRGDNGTLTRLVFTGGPTLARIMAHFENHPFLGHQQVIYDKFCDDYAQAPKRNRHMLPALECADDKETPGDGIEESPLSLAKSYLEPFFVGLLEGDGTITIGRTKGGNLSYGIFQIKVKYNTENHAMLALIAQHIGGNVSYDKRKKGNDQIRWVASSQACVKRILDIFETYPLLSSRKIHQCAHLKAVMQDRSWEYHLESRDSKYDGIQQLIDHQKDHFVIPDYFAPWLSGFFEAEGCFRCKHGHSVVICQNDDWYLLNAIKVFFGSTHKLSRHKDDRTASIHYRVSISGKPVLERMMHHFEAHPLLGYKKVSYNLFCESYRRLLLRKENMQEKKKHCVTCK